MHSSGYKFEIVDNLNLSRLTSACNHGGKQSNHPVMLMALQFYGYAIGVFSGREPELATRDSVSFRFITANRTTTRLRRSASAFLANCRICSSRF